MLRELTVHNYAIIEELAIEFHPGLNTITGETGAGKSIILGALSLLAGARADTSVVRDPSRNCVIEAAFDIRDYEGMQDLFTRNDLDYSDTITVRRIISENGRSRAFIDDIPVNLTTLRELSDRLIDIHSQHQTLLLAQSNFQTQIVDAVADHQKTLQQYAETYRQLRTEERQLEKLTHQSSEATRQKEYLTYQLEQLAALGLKPGEHEQLEERQLMLNNAGQIAQAIGFVSVALDDDESGVNITLHNTISALSRIRKHYPAADELCGRLESAYLELKDIASESLDLLEKVELNPAELETVNDRLDTINSLCQKHGAKDGNALCELSREMESELSELEGSDEKIEELKTRIDTLHTQAKDLAAQIHEGRMDAAPKIEQQVTATLRELGIKDALFVIFIARQEVLTSTGSDRIDFLFSANKGIEPQPIDQVASGGEMSRLMLSLKNLVSRKLKMPTIIFDEIDTGVSGQVADRTGEIIASMGTGMQVLNITHLPQVASKGQHHYLVYKDKGTHIRKLAPDERVEHIAMMLSGSNITDAARTQALELLNQKK